MLFTKKATPNDNFQIKLNNEIIKLSDTHKHLGVWLSKNMTWKKHISEIATKARKRLGCIKAHKYRLDRRSLELLYITFVRPVMEYGNVLFDSASDEDLDTLTDIEKDAMRVITGARARCNLDNLYNEFKWPSLAKRREIQKVAILGKIIIKRFPNYLVQDLPTFYDNARNNRNCTFAIPRCRTKYLSDSFVPSSIEIWNKLPSSIRSIKSYKALKGRLKGLYTKSIPKCYYNGPRAVNILHTKLRLGCSDLNTDKFRIGISDNNQCDCGEIETAEHYLLQCGSNLVAKVTMLDTIHDILVGSGFSNEQADAMVDIDLLLKGNPNLSTDINSAIIKTVYKFISASHRFD